MPALSWVDAQARCQECLRSCARLVDHLIRRESFPRSQRGARENKAIANCSDRAGGQWLRKKARGPAHGEFATVVGQLPDGTASPWCVCITPNPATWNA